MSHSKKTHAEKVVKKIESLCVQGCVEINCLLEKDKNGETITSLSGFSEEEKNQVIKELNQIMAVYGDES